MSGHLKLPISPPLYSTLKSLKKEVFIDINCVKPARIISYDPTKNTASVQIAFAQLMPNERAVQYQPLVDCPVITLQGGGIGARFPITPGDECLVFFADRCIDVWYENGAVSPQPPPDTRAHDLSDGFVLVGVNALVKPLMLALLPAEGGIADALAKVAITGGKVSVANAADSLFLILTFLVSTLSSMTTASIASGATQTAIATLTARLALLLY